MKKWILGLSVLAILLGLMVWGLRDCRGGETPTGGVVYFYPDLRQLGQETENMEGVTRLQLTPKQVKKLWREVNSIYDPIDDYTANHGIFYYNGHIEFEGVDNLYFFHYEHERVYYDHYYGIAGGCTTYLEKLEQELKKD